MLTPITLETRAALREALSLTRDALARVLATGETFRGVESTLDAAELELAATVSIADRRPLTPESQAAVEGWDVHHDLHGWYVVAPGEDDPDDGPALGFDGRPHYADQADAWASIVT